MIINGNKIFSKEYDSESTLGSESDILEKNDTNYNIIPDTEEEITNYGSSKPIRILIKAKIIND